MLPRVVDVVDDVVPLPKVVVVVVVVVGPLVNTAVTTANSLGLPNTSAFMV